MGFKSHFGLVWMEAKGNEGGDDVGEAIERTPMSCMLNLEDIFGLSKESFNQTSFPQQDFILQQDETLFHVGAQAGDKMEPSLQQGVDELLRDVPFVSKYFSLDVLANFFNMFSVINVA